MFSNILRDLTTTLEDQEIQHWGVGTSTLTGLFFYKNVKESFGKKHYFNLNLPIKILKFDSGARQLSPNLKKIEGILIL